MKITFVLLSLVFGLSAFAGNYSATAVGEREFVGQGSKSYRAERDALNKCRSDQQVQRCSVFNTVCVSGNIFKCKRWESTAVGTKEFYGNGSKPYRAERDALRKCRSARFNNCHITY